MLKRLVKNHNFVRQNKKLAISSNWIRCFSTSSTGIKEFIVRRAQLFDKYFEEQKQNLELKASQGSEITVKYGEKSCKAKCFSITPMDIVNTLCKSNEK